MGPQVAGIHPSRGSVCWWGSKLTTLTSYGSITLTFYLKASAPGIWRYSPFGWIRSKTVSLPLGLIPGKQKETLATIHRYFARLPAE